MNKKFKRFTILFLTFLVSLFGLYIAWDAYFNNLCIGGRPMLTVCHDDLKRGLSILFGLTINLCFIYKLFIDKE
jgi:hypothetical protein